MGIDMSRAFDTIKRAKILEILNTAGCNEDELRLTQALLANTQLTVRVKNTHSASFETTMGSPQGDSLSPVLFTCYLEAALREVRSNISWLNPPISNSRMPLEWEYADDVDFANEEQPLLTALLPVIRDTLEEWNLIVNESKTESVHVHLDYPSGQESWRKSKSLGSLLCSKAELTRRCHLGTVAFNSLWAMWMRRPLLTLEKRLLIYHTIIVPIMLYNCDSWAVPKTSLHQLDKCHRYHLRSILGIRWPNTISNNQLYARCNTQPLSVMVQDRRWGMLGHALRMPQDTPAQLALHFAVVGSQIHKSRRGRHQTNLLDTIRTDLKHHQLALKCADDIETLRALANDKATWRSMGKD